jgi:hypothetical protein
MVALNKQLAVLSICVLWAFGITGCASPTVQRNVASENAPLLTERALLPLDSVSIADLAKETSPWVNIEAYSDQRSPVYMGSKPYEMATGAPLKSVPELPAYLESDLKRLSQSLKKALKEPKVEFEVYPGMYDYGVTWVFSRWRKSAGDPWIMLNEAHFSKLMESFNDPFVRAPILPKRILPSSTAKRFASVFAEVRELEGLYDKPVFGDCVWANHDGSASVGAWLPLSERRLNKEAFKEKHHLLKNLACWVLPPPSRMNATPMVFTVQLSPGRTKLPAGIVWKETRYLPPPPKAFRVIQAFESNFLEQFKSDVEILAGERDAQFPISGRKMRFTRKNSADPANQLLDVAAYLDERYRQMGLTPEWQRFKDDDGIEHANLIVRIPGTLPPAKNKPIYLFDHYDTAFDELIYERNGQRVSVPGANDNCTAAATNLRAAQALKNGGNAHDVYIVHLTGEEFPKDTLGSRYLASQMMKTGQRMGAYFLNDMIGFRKPGDLIFQINAGQSARSLEVAATLHQVAIELAPRWKPTLRTRFDLKSYLNQTDGGIFEDHGFDGALINEHTHDFNNSRDNYHTYKDVSSGIDYEFATDIAKVVIESMARTANRLDL